MAGADDKGDGPGRTVYQPPPGAGAGSLPPSPEATTQRINLQRQPTIPPSGSRLAVGEVLNHIYEVRRFIDRGGMGETWEGVNINTDERVAIKVILPHLAGDPNVEAMFRREARTLTRLNHPALVQYRVLAHEPRLGVLYIVTEFVDGIGLDLLIGHMTPTEDQVRGLMRRLADGLRAAHELGAVHRDISPDNILAPEGRLEQSKIIDFGIAKDLQTSQATIVGSGFAGKLGFVAPEQFGDFNGEIGPWTDVYSLGLVMLAFATGAVPDMGTNLVEAVDKRRIGPDLSKAPASLKPLLQGMLVADPEKRTRSMDDVLAVLDKRPRSRAPSKPPVPTDRSDAPATPRAKSAPPKTKSQPPPAQKPKSDLKLPPTARPAGPAIPQRALIYAGVAFVAVLLIGVTAMLLMQPKGPKADTTAAGAGGPPISGAAAPPSALGRDIENVVQNASCTFLDYDLNGNTVTLRGGAGPGRVADAVTAIHEQTGLNVIPRTLGFEENACGAVDGLRSHRAPGDPWLTAPANAITPGPHPEECGPDPSYAVAVIQGAIGAPTEDAALVLVRPDGIARTVFAGRGGFQTLESKPQNFRGTAHLNPDGTFRVSLCNRTPGVYGVALIRGRLGGLIDPGLPQIWSEDTSPTPAGWGRSFDTVAKSRGWKTQMAWFTVNGGATQAAPPPTPVATAPTTTTTQPQTQSHGGSVRGGKGRPPTPSCSDSADLAGIVPRCHPVRHTSNPPPATTHTTPPPQEPDFGSGIRGDHR